MRTVNTQHRRLFLAMLFVFVIAFGLRWPACGESFWLDELHTAWCIFGSFDQVAQRAEMGSQQCGYFAAVYAWYHAIPESVIALYGIEPVLRLPCVLLTSMSAAWLVWIVARGNGNLVGGLTAGLALSLDSNAIFFGTELRPYAAIVLLATAALSVVMRNSSKLNCSNGAESFSLYQLLALHVIVLLAAATQVTSLTVLAPLLVVFSIADLVKHRYRSPRFARTLISHLIAGIFWMVIAVWWWSEHTSLWHARDAWSSFAIPRSWRDIWRMWPGTSLVLLPCTIAGLHLLWRRRDYSATRWRPQAGLPWIILQLFFIVVFATVACYLLSAFGDIPLWHRRYLVAALPLLCAITGLAIGSITDWRNQVALSLSCLLLLTVQQGTFERLCLGEIRFAQRGENWKSTIALLNQRLQRGDTVWIDAGLIEQSGQPTLITDPQLEEYLRYVTAGPYQLDPGIQPIGVGSTAIESWQTLNPSSDSSPAAQRDQPAALLTRRSGRVIVLLRSETQNP